MAGVTSILQEVNAIRVVCGGSPLSDLRPGNHSATTCPIANSLKDVIPGVTVGGKVAGIPRARSAAVASVTGGEIVSSNGKATVSSPLIAEFVRRFDSGAAFQQYNTY